MANIERITCDYLGCDRKYAYRVHGFNLCAHHIALFAGTWRDGLTKLMSRIQCPSCKLFSHHPMDVQERYCGFCNKFHSEMNG